MTDDLRLIWDAAPIGIARVDIGGRFLSANPKYCEMLGYSETELLGRTFQQVTHPDDVSPDVKEAEHLASNPCLRSYQMVKRYLSKDGRIVWVNMLVCAMRDAAGDFRNFLTFAIELTPVSSVPSSVGRGAPQPPAASILEYVRSNPKEAVIVTAVLFMLAQGKNIVDILLWLAGKPNT